MLASDAATSVVGEGAPSEGDMTICIGCGEILVFNSIGATEKISKETFDLLPDENREVLLGMRKVVIETKKILGK
jgi:hypothetical protein